MADTATASAQFELRALTSEQQFMLNTRGDTYEALAERLAELADSEILVIPADHEPHLIELTLNGALMDTSNARQVPGATSRCHSNVAARYDLGQCAFATGYALSRGMWRQHSWGVTKSGEILETTEPRDAYFGIVLDTRQANAMRHEYLAGQPVRHTPMNLSDLRGQLSDAIGDLLHAHRGDRHALLEDLAVALHAGEGYYATDFDDEYRVADIDAADSLHDHRLANEDLERLVALSPDAYRLLCGLVQPTDQVGRVGEHADVDIWRELRRMFPVGAYVDGPDIVQILQFSPIAKQFAARERAIDDVTEYPDVTEAVVIASTGRGDGWEFTIAVRLLADADVDAFAAEFDVLDQEAA